VLPPLCQRVHAIPQCGEREIDGLRLLVANEVTSLRCRGPIRDRNRERNVKRDDDEDNEERSSERSRSVGVSLRGVCIVNAEQLKCNL
jgi:hypothetical protein